MNTLNIYIIRDEVAQDNTFLVTAKNDEECKRNVKLALCSQTTNFVNTHTKDKRVVFVGQLNIDTGAIIAEAAPVPLFTVEEVRLDLVHEISVAKAQALDDLIKDGITKDKIDSVRDLLASLSPYFPEAKEEAVNA